MTMTHAEINRALAEAMGWTPHFDVDEPMAMPPESDDEWVPFSPATSSDHLREYVLPEIARRKLWARFIAEVSSSWANAPDGLASTGTLNRYLLLAHSSVLAAAALKVLEGAE